MERLLRTTGSILVSARPEQLRASGANASAQLRSHAYKFDEGWTVQTSAALKTGILALLISAAGGAAAQVYKWVDENGVVNYSNSAPSAAKKVTVVEDRISVYTPDKALLEATQDARDRRRASPSAMPENVRAVPVAPASSPLVADPCSINPAVDCYGVYAPSPVIVRKRRAPHLVQPQLPADAIAGNVNGGNGYIAGLSAFAPPATPAGAMRARGSSFTLQAPEDRPARWR